MIFLRKYKLYIKTNFKSFNNAIWKINDLTLIYKTLYGLELYYYHIDGHIGVRRQYGQLRYYIVVNGQNGHELMLNIDFIVPEIKIAPNDINKKNIFRITIETKYFTADFRNFKRLNGYLSYDVQGNRKVKI